MKVKKIEEVEEFVGKIKNAAQEFENFIDQRNQNVPIKLDIREQEYMTVGYNTLTKVPGSKLAAFFSSEPKKTAEGRVFVDRDPKVFKQMISYLDDPARASADTLMKIQSELEHW